MNFDSHMEGVLAVTVAAVNLLQPGHRHGRPYPGEATAEEVGACLAAGGSQFPRHTPQTTELETLRTHAARLYTVFSAVEAADMDEACATVNQVMADTGARPTLVRYDDRPWHLHFHAPDAGWATAWAAGMATSLSFVLGSPSAQRLGICSATQCDRVFVDTSRNGTRRFCSTTCQNRTKTAAFRARRAGQSG
ncbi:putative stress-induced transcription regulator [Haloactinospora alba]|uniref:Putative stress-induced transcription regulator n=1 Tax=Haloactinospora alba TaxID=405555 RepID=A0A543NEH6_9ACTN|nr:CGNR zinc finger domain-containing protein [Haloactinospora alba]TQN30248.1 putative stress-induced transcription regulator [Haloactinospora alba]